MIHTRHITAAVLDALGESLYNHAQAHRVQPSSRQSTSLPLDQLQQALSYLKSTRPSPLNRGLIYISGILELIPRPFLNLGFKTVASYHFFGITGIVTACLYPMALALALGISTSIVFALLLISAALTWAYVKLTIRITGKDTVVFFNYFLMLLGGIILLLILLNQPVLMYLDVMILGAGLLFGFGRIGCFMAGCCYGKPSPIGIRYDKHHKKNGFPLALIRVRLLPTQLMESAGLFTITCICTLLLFALKIPGLALSTFLTLLALERFLLEFFRGDSRRPYLRGLSQAQWTSIVILATTLVLQGVDILPYHPWQSFILASFLILLITFVLSTHNVSLSSLYSARHIHEIAEMFDVFKRGTLIPASTRRAVHLKKTSLNIQLSENRIPILDRTILHHITLSAVDRRLSYRNAAGLARYMVSWYQQAGIHVLLPEKDNIYHLIYFTIDTGT